MPSEIYVGATEPRRMAVTVNEGVFADITIAGVALREDPNDIPDADPQPDVSGSIDYQVFVLLRTADYDFIRKPDVLTVLGNPPA